MAVKSPNCIVTAVSSRKVIGASDADAARRVAGRHRFGSAEGACQSAGIQAFHFASFSSTHFLAAASAVMSWLVM